MGGGGTLNASAAGGSLEASSSSSSLNPLKRITSRNRTAGGGGGAGSVGEHELDGTAIVKSVRGPRKPLDGEEPAATIRVRVVRAEGLVSRDRNGLSDP
jgi:phosphatidylserine decarboxylase